MVSGLFIWNRRATAVVTSRELFALTSSHPVSLRQITPQHSISFTAYKGTVRGLHYQREPHSEAKVVRCLKGVIWDVLIDIRPESPTYLRWQQFELSSENGHQLYVPAGFAHGYQTLCDDVEVNYLISVPYAPQSACGIRYNDPTFGITWPLPVTEISEKDVHWPNFSG